MEYKLLEDKVKSYNPNANFDYLKKAYDFAYNAHKGQLRASGEPYFVHPFNVAMILADLKLDVISVAAGLLHDVVEDTNVTCEDIEKHFGSTMCLIIDGVTKISNLPFKSKEEFAAENLRKMLFALIKDIRVILVKLADRLNNIRTISALPIEKQKRIARETLEIYAPLANRLGMHSIKVELEDTCFKICEPEIARELETKLLKDKQTAEKYINSIIETLKRECAENNIPCEIFGRQKHLYSIYKKINNKDKSIDDIYDIIGIRVLVNTVNDCYAVLGLVHKLWKPIMGRFKDYIAVPKTNLYQSLHTTIVHSGGEPVEIQIRTHLMHRIAEEGIAAHWSYKEGGNKNINEAQKFEMAWLRQIINWHRDVTDAREYIETIKIDLYQDEVFVFTPKGDIKVLTAKSTPLDFAYLIHSEVGHKCVGAKVNGKMVALDYELKNGDIVEILTSNSAKPSKDWLKIVKSSHAKAKIKAWFKNEERQEAYKKGREIFNEYYQNHVKDIIAYYESINKNPFDSSKTELIKDDFEINKLLKSKLFLDVLEELNFKAIDDFFVIVGRGEYQLKNLFNKLFPDYFQNVVNKNKSIQVLQQKKVEKKSRSINGVIVSNCDDVLVRFSKCCTPVPGDEIVGFITRGRGISIHRKNCPNFIQQSQLEKERIVEVKWDVSKLTGSSITYATKIRIKAIDRPNLLLHVTNIISNSKLNIYELHAKVEKNFAIIEFTVDISNTLQLDDLIKNIEKIDGVINVYRIEGTN